ncbi:hypothetical protein [Candidatus Regiella endosymbiont of Tuberolachnus salignus]
MTGMRASSQQRGGFKGEGYTKVNAHFERVFDEISTSTRDFE